MRTFLILDCNCLCWRAHHVLGHLKHGDEPTGILFGFLRDLQNLKDLHATENVIFCFDYGTSKRRELYPEYKGNRKEGTLQEQAVRTQVYQQIDKLRTEYLHELGYRKVFFQKGYEADDVIASVVQEQLVGDKVIVVSADKDLYQLLCFDNVIIWSLRSNGKPHVVNCASFNKEYGIGPNQWAEVKAIAGCSSDNVKGVKGVGEIKAIQYLNGSLSEKSKAYKEIENGGEVIERNRKLMRLPFSGTEKFKMQEDELSNMKWRKFCKRFGIKSLSGSVERNLL